jgi:hypothetical protein
MIRFFDCTSLHRRPSISPGFLSTLKQKHHCVLSFANIANIVRNMEDEEVQQLKAEYERCKSAYVSKCFPIYAKKFQERLDGLGKAFLRFEVEMQELDNDFKDSGSNKTAGDYILEWKGGQVASNEASTELRLLYRKLSIRHHPDKSTLTKPEATILFQKIVEYYQNEDLESLRYFDQHGVFPKSSQPTDRILEIKMNSPTWRWCTATTQKEREEIEALFMTQEERDLHVEAKTKAREAKKKEREEEDERYRKLVEEEDERYRKAMELSRTLLGQSRSARSSSDSAVAVERAGSCSLSVEGCRMK